MRPEQLAFISELLLALFADRPRESVSQFCERVVYWNEPEYHGPYSLIGREYAREPLDLWADRLITDETLVWGSQTGKTGVIMGGATWTIIHEPARMFWVMPTKSDVAKFSKSRWQPMVEASPELAKLKPAIKAKFTYLLQFIGNAIIDMVWSNSPSALASVPARVIIQDEIDKFRSAGEREAGSVELADARAKSFAVPKRVKTSTPTIPTAPIWRYLQESDFRRRFLPCPYCAKHVVLAWSKEYTTLALTGKEAWAKWDPKAKRKTGEWDLDQVVATAHYLCPHCGGQIRDAHKTSMDRAGVWIPTNPTAPKHHRGYHLPSLYAASIQTNVGAEALKFLAATKSLEGLQFFITNELAEPWENQEARSQRVEIIAGRDAPPIAKATPILTADYQLLKPHLPYVIRNWQGNSRLDSFGFLDTWEELRAVQIQHVPPIADNHVCIDSGHDADEVYNACLRHGELIPQLGGAPLWVGWTPAKGFDRRDQWIDRKTGLRRPWNVGAAALPHKRFQLPLLEFSTNHVKDILERLRTGQTRFLWELTEDADAEYFKHLDAEIKTPFYDKQSRRMRYIWRKRTKFWPDHLRDCEIEQIVMAFLHRVLLYGQLEQAQTPPAKDGKQAPAAK